MNPTQPKVRVFFQGSWFNQKVTKIVSWYLRFRAWGWVKDDNSTSHSCQFSCCYLPQMIATLASDHPTLQMLGEAAVAREASKICLKSTPPFSMPSQWMLLYRRFLWATSEFHLFQRPPFPVVYVLITPLKINMEHNSLEVWFRSFSFLFMGDL